MSHGEALSRFEAPGVGECVGLERGAEGSDRVIGVAGLARVSQWLWGER